MKHCFPILSIVLALSVAACSAAPVGRVAVPDSLRVADDLALSVEASATGVQIYECTASEEHPSEYVWKFKAPEASLSDSSGHVIGKHYAGPTWEAFDGSKVLGAVMAQAPAPEEGSIPWLLLAAKSTSGLGIFGETRMIRRLRTNGGVAPVAACGRDNLSQIARVPYTATYEFYGAMP
jgi:Protein of unknown function (DUF3455)